MNQAEQRARIIALERAAEKDAKAIAYLRASTIEVERIIALEQQVTAIAGMVNQAARETEARITALEKQVARHAAEAIANLSVASVDQRNRIEQLETCATLNAETIGHVAGLRRFAAEQVKRIEKLEARAALNADEEQRLQVVANAAVINRMHNSIEKLEVALQNVARCLIDGKMDVDMALPDKVFRHYG